MIRRLGLLGLLVLAACGVPAVMAEESPQPPDEAPVEQVVQVETQNYTTTTATTEPREVTTTTHKPYETTTTYKHDTTTTEKPPHTYPTTTTTVAPTTTLPATTTTHKPYPTTTTTMKPTTTTSSSTTSTSTSSTTSTTSSTSTTSTTQPPKPSLFAVNVFAFCGPDFLPEISITFGDRPDLNGQVGVLSFSTGGSVFLTFQSNQTVTIAYPNTTQNVNLIYSLGPETATASVTFPPNCPPTTTTTAVTTSTTTTTTLPPTTTTLPPTTTTVPPTSTTGPTTTTSPSTTTTTTIPGTTTTGPTIPGTTTTTVPAPPFTFGAAATVCVAEVPTIRIVFQNTFPELAGRTGTLTMSDINGNVVSTQPLVYAPGTTVDLLYPGTTVNSDGTIADVPGWILTSDGFWIRDPSDEFLRAGINLTYTVNPTATAFVTYPPESATCANPNGPFPPGVTPPPEGLPPTGSNSGTYLAIAALALGSGLALFSVGRKRRRA